MSYLNYIQEHEYFDTPYNYQPDFPIIWSDSRIPRVVPPTQGLPTAPEQRKSTVDLMDQDLIFSPDGTMVIAEAQTIPLVYYTHRLRENYRFHYKNRKTATCNFLIKGFSEHGFPAHRAYFATQSLYFRTIFERHNFTNEQDVEIELPYPDVFPGIYQYFYDGDEEAWLKYWFKDREQVKRSWELAKYLELVGVPEKVSLRARMELEAVRLT